MSVTSMPLSKCSLAGTSTSGSMRKGGLSEQTQGDRNEHGVNHKDKDPSA